MTHAHAEAIALMDGGRFDEAVARLSRAVGENPSDHEALFLVGCLCFEGNEMDAHRAFSAALAAKPGDPVYALFENLARIKLTDPRFEGGDALECVEPAAQAMRSNHLSAFPLAILVRLFDRAGRDELAAEAYERALRAQGREELAASFAHCRGAEADWAWDETIARLRREIRDGAFGADDLARWLRYLPEGRDEKTDALRRVLVQTVLTHRQDPEAGHPGIFGEPPLENRCLVVAQVSGVGWGERGDIWISPARREWDVNVLADAATKHS
jgi:tetratricopeptide (TPR) repeat protein